MVSDAIGLILAGGQARRMGGADKAFVEIGGESLLMRTMDRARPQVGELIVSANGDPARFRRFGLEVVTDPVQGFLGPLAGILAGLEWIRENRPKAHWLASFACDCPFFPTDLVERLVKKANAEKASIAVASSGGRHHPVFAVWRTDIKETSEEVLVQGEFRKMDDWIDEFDNTRVVFSVAPFDPFFNINTPDDVERAESLLAA